MVRLVWPHRATLTSHTLATQLILQCLNTVTSRVLHLVSQCNRTRALDLYNSYVVRSNLSVVAIIGCGCSSATEEVTMATNGTLPVVSYTKHCGTVIVLSLGHPQFFSVAR